LSEPAYYILFPILFAPHAICERFFLFDHTYPYAIFFSPINLQLPELIAPRHDLTSNRFVHYGFVVFSYVSPSYFSVLFIDPSQRLPLAPWIFFYPHRLPLFQSLWLAFYLILLLLRPPASFLVVFGLVRVSRSFKFLFRLVSVTPIFPCSHNSQLD